jgi:hypothetical protein
MSTAATCTVEKFTFYGGKVVPRIRFGSEKPPWRMEGCGDCGVARGGYHHPGCDIEQCPECLEQSISCGCRDAACGDDGSDYVDVPAAISLLSKLIREDPAADHLFIDLVAPCGHVARGHIRDMPREDDLPLEEWFGLGGWASCNAAAILFVCRASNFESVQEADLEVARRMASYAETETVAPWDLVFVTERGNFKASDLLGLPGHPEWIPCTPELRLQLG